MPSLKYWDGSAWQYVLSQVGAQVVESYGRYEWAANVVNTTQNAFVVLPAGGTWTKILESLATQFDTSTGIFTCRRAGVYLINAVAVYASIASATGNRGVGVGKNGTSTASPNGMGLIGPTTFQGNSAAVEVSGLMALAVGDTLTPLMFVNGQTPNFTGFTLNVELVEPVQLPSTMSAEYAMSGGNGASTTCPQSQWTFLPFGAVATQSADAATCYRFNADGTFTVLKDGWYEVFFQAQVPALAVDSGVQYGIWASPTDTAPAVSPAAGPGPGPRNEFSMPTSGAPIIAMSTGPMYVTAGTRLGASLYNRAASIAFLSAGWSVARIGAGPQGPAGAALTEQEGISDFSATAGTYSMPNGTWGTPGWYAPLTVGPNQTWELQGMAGVQCVTALHTLNQRMGVRDNTGAALGAAYGLSRNPVVISQPSAISVTNTMQSVARLVTDGTVPAGTIIRLVQEFLGNGANGRVVRDGTYYQSWAWRRV